MRTYKEIQESVGPEPEYPTKQYIYYAYKNGTSTSFLTRTEAEQYSKLVERVQIHEEEYENQLDTWAKWNTRVNEQWYWELKDEYDTYKPGVFLKIYEKAYDKGHSDGYDQIKWYVEDLCDFVDEILKLYDIPE